MSENSTVSLSWGGLHFRIEAPLALVSRIRGEFSHFLRADSRSAADALVIRVIPDASRLERDIRESLRMGPIRLHERGVLVRDGLLLQNYGEIEGTLFVEAHIEPTAKRRLASTLPPGFQRLLNMRYATVEDLQYVDFVYGVLLPALQIAMLARNNSFLHSSAVFDEESSGAIVFGSWGGIGKTSVSASLLLRDERYSFMSDDQTLVSADGHVFANPLGVHLYPYNTAAFPDLQRRMWDGRGKLDRFHWWLRSKLVGPAGVVRRVSPMSLYPRIRTNANISRAIWLERNMSASRAEITSMSAEEFASRASHVTMHEFRRLVNLFVGLGAIGRQLTGLSGIQDFFNKTKNVYLNFLSNVNVVKVTIPGGWHAEELGSFMKKDVLTGSLR